MWSNANYIEINNDIDIDIDIDINIEIDIDINFDIDNNNTNSSLVNPVHTCLETFIFCKIFLKSWYI